MVISALQARARQVSGTGQVKQGKRRGENIEEVLLFVFAVQKHQQMEKGVRAAGRSSLLAQRQDRKLDIHSEESCGVQVGVCDSLILMSTVRINTGLPGLEIDSGHPLPVLPLAQRTVRHS